MVKRMSINKKIKVYKAINTVLHRITMKREFALISKVVKVEEINRLLESDELANPARQSRAQLHLESYWLEYLNELMNSREYELGYTNASNALNQLPKSTKIKAMQNGFYNNLIATIHNNFAKQANAGNFEAARSTLEEGLEKFPNDKTLKKDFADLQRVAK